MVIQHHQPCQSQGGPIIAFGGMSLFAEVREEWRGGTASGRDQGYQAFPIKKQYIPNIGRLTQEILVDQRISVRMKPWQNGFNT